MKINGRKLASLREEKIGSKLEMAIAWANKFNETITPQTIWNWERGKTITRNNLRKLAELLGEPKESLIITIKLKRKFRFPFGEK